MTKERFLRILGGLLLLFGILPLQLNVATIPLLLMGALLLSNSHWKEKWRKLMLYLCCIAIPCVLIYLTVLGYFAYGRQPENQPCDDTVVVLGCSVVGDRPSRMLRRRLDTAVDYLSANPDAACIVTGGQGWNEDCTEASVMAAYLASHGIEESRIYLEDQSANTRQNLENAQAIISEEKLDEDIVIISDGFHQFRSRLIASKLNMNSSAVSANTSLHLIPAYAFREVLSLIKLLPFLLG